MCFMDRHILPIFQLMGEHVLLPRLPGYTLCTQTCSQLTVASSKVAKQALQCVKVQVLFEDMTDPESVTN